MAFYIFRHGDTQETNNIWIRIFGRNSNNSTNIDIEQRATPALQKIGLYLKNKDIEKAFTSPYPRCVNSAKIVNNNLKVNFKADDRIRELEKNGETLKQFENRIRLFLKDIESKKYRSVAICTHGAIIGAFKHLLTNDKFNFYNIWDFPQPGNLVVIKNKGVKTINFN